jgi:hypothetical protein
VKRDSNFGAFTLLAAVFTTATALSALGQSYVALALTMACFAVVFWLLYLLSR